MNMDFWLFQSQVVAPIVSALAMVLVSILAIWGENIKPKPKLILKLCDIAGEDSSITITPSSNAGFGLVTKFSIPATFYHLKVVNKNRVLAKNVQVLCLNIYKKSNKDTTYSHINTNVIQQFVWAPSEVSPVTPNILKDHVLDFGSIENNRFALSFYVTPNNFQGFISKGEYMKVDIEIVADNFVDNKIYSYEVYFNDKKGVDIKEIK